MFDDINDLYQEVIMDHSKRPRNFGKLDGANRIARGHNPLCGDNVVVYLLMENDRVKDVKFEGSGCAISVASASVMTDALKGKTKDEAKVIFNGFHDLVSSGHVLEAVGLEKLQAFGGVNKFPARVKCAILAWHAANSALDGGPDVSTENSEGQKLS